MGRFTSGGTYPDKDVLPFGWDDATGVGDWRLGAEPLGTAPPEIGEGVGAPPETGAPADTDGPGSWNVLTPVPELSACRDSLRLHAHIHEAAVLQQPIFQRESTVLVQRPFDLCL